MYFITTAGSIDYVGNVGDQIILSDTSIVNINETNQVITFTAPAGTHKVVLVDVVDRNNYVSIGNEALVELVNFPTLSSVTRFNFTTFEYRELPNLIKVPTTLPSNITELRNMFIGATSFNQDISMWDTSNVTDMSYMFEGTPFNQPIGSWDVSNVIDMHGMFIRTTSFNQPLNNWNTSKVIDMGDMFNHATSFNQDLSQWCVPLILSLPGGFNFEGIILPENYPVWGTCPT